MQIFACNSYNDIPYTYKSPENLSDSLLVATISDVKIDSTLIYQAIKRIKGGALGQTHSILIYRDTKLVVEEYFPGNKYNDSDLILQNLSSADQKLVVSTRMDESANENIYRFDIVLKPNR